MSSFFFITKDIILDSFSFLSFQWVVIMAYKISDRCIECDSCRPLCPTGAINVGEGQYEIDPELCDRCENYEEPQCVIACPLSLPVPIQAKKGRFKAIEQRPTPSPNLFTNGRSAAFASAIVVWETCNLLAQRRSLAWQEVEDSKLVYQRSVNQGRGLIELSLSQPWEHDIEKPVVFDIDAVDIRAACLHLIYAAYATTLDNPWEQEFIINDQQIEAYLGLDKRKDLSKSTKLTLIKDLAQQPCLIKASINWFQQGRVLPFQLTDSRLWHLLEIQHHFQDDDIGCKHLVGLTFRVRAGLWAKYFLNRSSCKEGTAFYQYSHLPKSLLTTIMSVWQQHEGAARMMLWLLFKVRMGREQRITVPTLMRIAYGEEKVAQATSNRDDRKRLLRTFESDLEALNHYGLRPAFDPVTYPIEIQPLWSKLADLPEDPDEALEFWMNDANGDSRLTDASPRGKWNLLMNARILCFDLPQEWDEPLGEFEKRRRRGCNISHRDSLRKKKLPKPQGGLSSNEIVSARKRAGWSQRELAEKTGKSQSWIRDIENGRFQVKSSDQAILRKVLQID